MRIAPWRDFKKSLALAKMILDLQGPDRDQAGRSCFALMFDMNVVFEGFVAAEIGAALRGTGLAMKAPIGGRSLLIKDGRQQFRLKPDVGVWQTDRFRTLLDTKWKAFDLGRSHNGVSQSDMYQMYAYGKEFDVARTVLVYPRHGNLPARVATYQHPRIGGIQDAPRFIDIATVNISVPLLTREGTGQLRSDLRELAC